MEIVECNILYSNETILVHQINCIGVMGKLQNGKVYGGGLAGEIRRRYPVVFLEYSKLCSNSDAKSLLGKVHLISVEDRVIANLFAQESISKVRQMTDVRAFRSGMKILANYCRDNNTSLAIPYGIGCNRGGGNWNIISNIIQEELKGVQYRVYRLDI